MFGDLDEDHMRCYKVNQKTNSRIYEPSQCYLLSAGHISQEKIKKCIQNMI